MTTDDTTEKLLSSILFIEDDHGHAMLVQRILTGFTDRVLHVDTLLKAQKALKAERFSLVISDLNLPDGKELQIVEKVLSLCGTSPVIVLTTSNSVTTAVEAMKLGARDYLVKNFNGDFKDLLGITLRRTADIARLEEERAAIFTQMSALRLAVNNSKDGLAVYENSGKLIYANHIFNEYCAHIGGESKEMRTIISDLIVKGDFIRGELEKIRTEDRSAGFWSTEISIKDGDPSAFQIAVSSLTETENTKDSRQFALWLRDITSEKHREKFQREILSTTTHDLKGPLGAIMLSAEMIGSSIANTDKVKELALRISSSAHGAVHLIDEFLSARRIQEGTFVLKPRAHETLPLLKEICEEFEASALAKKITLSVDPQSKDISASFDKLGIVRVIGNLISNALKFTPKGGSVVLSLNDLGEEYQISIEDTGPGMESHEVQRLFERFSRLSKHAEVAGTGLGLFVVKCIVGAHGGTIDVKSSVGKGTRFSINLPKHPPVNANGELISLDFA